MLKWNSRTLATYCEELTHWKRPWCWKRLKAGGQGDKALGWHHWFNGHGSEHAPWAGERQGSLVCCNPWGHKELDMTEPLNNNNVTSIPIDRDWGLLPKATWMSSEMEPPVPVKLSNPAVPPNSLSANSWETRVKPPAKPLPDSKPSTTVWDNKPLLF